MKMSNNTHHLWAAIAIKWWVFAQHPSTTFTSSMIHKHWGLSGIKRFWKVRVLQWATRRAVAQWLRHCPANRQAAGSIPDGIPGIFHWHNPSGRTMALGLTQPLTEMSTRIFPGGKCGWCAGLTTLPPSCAKCLKIWESQPPGTLRACNEIALPHQWATPFYSHTFHTTNILPTWIGLLVGSCPSGLQSLRK
jgi:hypothetical protein